MLLILTGVVPFKEIVMDFIAELPESGDFNAIPVVTDWFTKVHCYIPAKTVGKYSYFSQNLPIMPQPPLLTNTPTAEVSISLIDSLYTLIITRISPPPPQKNAWTECLQCTTTSTISSNPSKTKKSPYTLTNLDSFTTMIES